MMQEIRAELRAFPALSQVEMQRAVRAFLMRVEAAGAQPLLAYDLLLPRPFLPAQFFILDASIGMICT
jgi:hypothetical protein